MRFLVMVIGWTVLGLVPTAVEQTDSPRDVSTPSKTSVHNKGLDSKGEEKERREELLQKIRELYQDPLEKRSSI